MADLCLVYARPSKMVVRRLYEILSSDYTVWWDEHIQSGDYRSEIEKQLSDAKCVIPVWCRVSRADSDVIDEAGFARSASKLLLPIRIEDVEPPLGFGNLHTINLVGWRGDADDPRIVEFLRNLKGAIGARPRLLNRPANLKFEERSIPLPVFFKSVSSHETQLTPRAAIEALRLFDADAILVSAYDMVRDRYASEIIAELNAMSGRGTALLLDSGNYEAYRKSDTTWKVKGLVEALKATPHDLALSFDVLDPPPDVEATVEAIVNGAERDGKHTKRAIVPIVHAPRDKNGEYHPELLPEIMRRVARHMRPPMIAVPERELGNGLTNRARTVFEIRRRLDELGFYQMLHMLGTGNPISIAVLAAVGADSFDGLEWCRTAADQETGRLYHFQQYDFFAWQTKLASSAVVRQAASDDRVSFAGKAVLHNLDVFETWMQDLRDAMATNKFDRFLTDKLPKGGSAMKQLELAVPEIFG